VRYDLPPGWSVKDNLDSVSLWKTSKGGAITISFVEASGSALEFCERFAARQAPDPARLDGTADVASAAFTDHDGVWCKLRVLSAGPRMLVASYHASEEDAREEAEADAILASLRLK
jgi:hypothetical protein